MKQLKEILNQTNEDIIAELDKFLALKPLAERRLIEAMRYSSMSYGKRLRPVLVLESSNLFNVPRFQALKVATAIEMVHCYSLIHDDLPAMDNDDMRRGIPTCHKQFDEATAILAGDALLTKAFEILSSKETHNNPEVRSELVFNLAKASGGMLRGQMIDIMPEEEHKQDLNYIKRLQKLKTGALIGFSCAAGVILGGGSDEDFARLRAYAEDIGLAFQITDDVLDVEGDAKLVGKTLGKDERDQKATFVSVLGVEGAKTMAKELVETAISVISEYGMASKTLQDIAKFILVRKR